MCANIVEKAIVAGSGRGQQGWFRLEQAYVSYDHPFHTDVEHALNIDFVNEAQGVEARVAVELSLEAARELARAIMAAVARAEAYEGIGDREEPPSAERTVVSRG
ncbi:MAG: DUF6295 family protein [Tepidiformaceae bacterium]